MAMTPLGGNENGSDIMAEINITPLTDIFLVLLIIFMITSSAMIESGGKVNLPKAVATQSEARGTTVTLTPKREIYVKRSEGNARVQRKDSPRRPLCRSRRGQLLGPPQAILSVFLGLFLNFRGTSPQAFNFQLEIPLSFEEDLQI
jgi:Biopolymer transport protein ExbD/TolR